MSAPERVLWKKVATRNLSFLFVDYVLTSYPSMERKVGTALRHNLVIGENGLVTIYRDKDDVQHSYDLIEQRAAPYHDAFLQYGETLEYVSTKLRKLIEDILKTTERDKICKLLWQFDTLFLEFMHYQLFFVYLGYAAHLPSVRNFVDIYQKRIEEYRMSTLYQEIDRLLPELFGKLHARLKDCAHWLTRKEIAEFIERGALPTSIIEERKKRYLRIQRDFEIADYPLARINEVLAAELGHMRKEVSDLAGSTAFPGKIHGSAVIVCSPRDYQKITPESVVVASMTVPDMVPYLTNVKGIVTNDGGTLCHASIVAREFRIPTVVGTECATEVFKDGDLVEVDANNGVVRKIK